MGYLDHPSLVDYSCFLHSACIAIRKTCRDYAADGVERPCWGQGRHGSPHTMVDSGSKSHGLQIGGKRTNGVGFRFPAVEGSRDRTLQS